MRSSWVAGLAIAVGLMSSPTAALAQTAGSGIAGVVKDASGAVLPGVTVEASSDALIEKVRTVTTDGQGQYKIVDLRPGTYTVTFTLAGFSTIRREGIELTANFTAPVNADLRVGAVAETITVSGATPLVDTQNVVKQEVLSRDLLDSIPNNKAVQSYAVLTPGLVIAPQNQDVGGSRGEGTGGFAIHGGRENDSRLLLDGFKFMGMTGSSSAANRGFYINAASSQEITLATSGTSAEADTGGVLLNAIPKEGGNRLSGYLFGNYTGPGLQTTNLTNKLRNRGLSSGSGVQDIYDINLAFGGPLKRDRLWFYTAHRWWGSGQDIPNDFFNATQGTPFYTPDVSRPAALDDNYRDNNIRLTWQAAQKHKINFAYYTQDNCVCYRGLRDAAVPPAPEAATRHLYADPNYIVQTTWSYVASDRLLFEAGNSTLMFNTQIVPQPEAVDAIAILEQSTNFAYGSASGTVNYGQNRFDQSNQRLSASYITGSHAFKVGLVMQEGWNKPESLVNSDVSYTFNRGVPVSLTQWAPIRTENRLKANLGLFAQDQWTIQRLTLNLGVRFDYVDAFVPAQSLPADRYLPAREYGAVDCVPCWTDVSPRFGAAYDLFGNGKTAVKATFGRYVQGSGVDLALANNPVNTSVNSVTRTWTDLNGDFIPNCDLSNPNLNGECARINNLNFGSGNPTATSYDRDVLRGYAQRPFQWQSSATIQHELRPGMSATFGYYRTWYDNFRATSNVALTSADFTPYSIVAPLDLRLPGGGGYVIDRFFDVIPTRFGVANTVVTQAASLGKQTEASNFFNIGLSARLPNGGRIAGAVDTGRTVTDNCDIVTNNLQVAFNPVAGVTPPRTMDYCHVTTPFSAQTQFKMYAVYPLPWGFQASGTYINLSGIPISATYVATNAEIAPSLGRNLSSCGAAATCNATVTVDLVPPQTMFEPRQGQLDLRLTKIFGLGRSRLQAMFDLYNVLNASPVLVENNRFGSSWQVPSQILSARLFKFGAQLTF